MKFLVLPGAFLTLWSFAPALVSADCVTTLSHDFDTATDIFTGPNGASNVFTATNSCGAATGGAMSIASGRITQVGPITLCDEGTYLWFRFYPVLPSGSDPLGECEEPDANERLIVHMSRDGSNWLSIFESLDPGVYGLGTWNSGCAQIPAGDNSAVYLRFSQTQHTIPDAYLVDNVSLTPGTGATTCGAYPDIVVVPSSGAGGDPHFKTWAGAQFDFHGHCDLVLLDAPHLGERATKGPHGLAIHIRSAPYKTVYSYISRVALKLGEDIIEIGQQGELYVNGEQQALGVPLELSSTGLVYPMTTSKTKRGRYVYKIHLGGRESLRKKKQPEINIREYRNWFTISIINAEKIYQDFRDSAGLMGSFPKGIWIGRDQATIHKDIQEYGKDWVVHGREDGDLFQVASPFPEECHVPSVVSVEQRRLLEASVTREEAVEACAHWVRPETVDACISDVLVAGDLDRALEDPI